jgi:large subunit ribosomal protein L13Ae
MFDKEVIIDAKGHMMGRLAAYVAKELLSGQRVVIVRAEEVLLSGILFTKRNDFLEFLNKQSNTNPRHGGPYHFRAPNRMLWRAIKGMVPRKTQRGKAALERLKIFEGVPFPYSHRKRQVMPRAMRVVRLQANR